ncbi:hypothetical protein HGRIS_009073 [Hohenbuehelia grisea]|uniref:Uncharacterized protein n=1 Tax=Hohenbuehelia grisea TaxID=104357 RepID=A0ABR3J0D2_9AGAR
MKVLRRQGTFDSVGVLNIVNIREYVAARSTSLRGECISGKIEKTANRMTLTFRSAHREGAMTVRYAARAEVMTMSTAPALRNRVSAEGDAILRKTIDDSVPMSTGALRYNLFNPSASPLATKSPLPLRIHRTFQRMDTQNAQVENSRPAKDEAKRKIESQLHDGDLGEVEFKFDAEGEPENINANYQAQVSPEGPKNTRNVIGGHKATIANPKVSDEAKEYSRQVLKDEFDVEA